ncbi:YihY/virulence factor BrkB family protein [Candidatus Poriferisodalis sp.]|uniref:YihY/virulence factor BrkB family protein n=1 Tax=Candidatus Poriferisodalis sp. TaxID=3101277 RepID=UPI003B0266A0
MATTPTARWRSVARDATRLANEVRHDWTQHRIAGLAAEIAFFALLGLFPAVIVFAALLGSLDVLIGQSAATGTEEWLLERISDTFGDQSALDAAVAELFARSDARVVTVGVAVAAYAASRGFVAVVRALNVSRGHHGRRSWLSTRLVGFALTFLTLLAATAVAAMVVVGPLLGSGADLADRLGAGSAFSAAWDWLRWPVVVIVVIAWAATVYRIAPLHKLPWRSEIPGALLATVWWLTVSGGFGAYLRLASNDVNAVFGLLGGALSLLLWLYLLAMGLLAGAELNRLLDRWRTRSRPPSDAVPTSSQTPDSNGSPPGD